MQHLIWVLVWVICAGAVVRCQGEFPYLSFRGENLTNHSFVNLNDVGPTVGSEIQCRTDLETCCNAASGPDRGNWYGPDGARLPFSGDGVVYLVRLSQYVSVRRNGIVGLPDEGIYQCTIPVMSANTTTSANLYVGVYFVRGI